LDDSKDIVHRIRIFVGKFIQGLLLRSGLARLRYSANKVENMEGNRRGNESRGGFYIEFSLGFKGRVKNGWRFIGWVVKSLVGRYDDGEFAVRSIPENSAESERRVRKMFECYAQVKNWENLRAAPPVFIVGGSRRGKRQTSGIENAYVAANYVHWMTERIQNRMRNNAVFTTEPTEVPRSVWTIWTFRQKVICFWRYRFLNDPAKFRRRHIIAPNEKEISHGRVSGQPR
jgi:hypothetical protein